MLTIPRAQFETLVAHCRAALPDEACGFLAGRGGAVESVHPVASASPSPARFAMEPRAQLAALEAIDRAGREVVGIYHSHPGGAPSPSALDRGQAFWAGTAVAAYPGAVQVIVALPAAGAPAVRGFLPERGSLREIPVALG